MRELFDQNKSFYVYQSGLRSTHIFFRIHPNGETCNVSRYLISPDQVEICYYKGLKEDVLEVCQDGVLIEDTYFELFSLFYRKIKHIVNSLLDLAIEDEDLRYLLKDERFQLSVMKWENYDSVTATQNQIDITIRADNCYLRIENSFFNGYDRDYVPEPPYQIEINIWERELSPTKYYTNTISEEMYNIFDTMLMTIVELWSELCYTIQG